MPQLGLHRATFSMSGAQWSARPDLLGVVARVPAQQCACAVGCLLQAVGGMQCCIPHMSQIESRNGPYPASCRQGPLKRPHNGWQASAQALAIKVHDLRHPGAFTFPQIGMQGRHT